MNSQVPNGSHGRTSCRSLCFRKGCLTSSALAHNKNGHFVGLVWILQWCKTLKHVYSSWLLEGFLGWCLCQARMFQEDDCDAYSPTKQLGMNFWSIIVLVPQCYGCILGVHIETSNAWRFCSKALWTEKNPYPTVRDVAFFKALGAQPRHCPLLLHHGVGWGTWWVCLTARHDFTNGIWI